MAAVKFSETRWPGCDAILRETVNRELIHRGVLVQLQTKFYISLVHTERDIDYAVDAFGAALWAATEGETGLQLGADICARAGPPSTGVGDPGVDG